MTDVTFAHRDVFVAYSSDARDFAQHLCARLEAAGLSVFLDEKVLRGGEGYDSAIRAAIQSCTAFVFVVSPGSVAGDAYALTELHWAVQARRPLYAVYADAAEPVPLPPELAAVTVPRPRGDPIAPVVAQLADLVAAKRARARWRRLGIVSLCGVAVALGVLALSVDRSVKPASVAPAQWVALDGAGLQGLSTASSVRLTADRDADAITLSWHNLDVRQFRRYDFAREDWQTMPALRTDGEPDYLEVLAVGRDRLLTLWGDKEGPAPGLYASWYTGRWSSAAQIAPFARKDSAWALRAAADGHAKVVRLAWVELPTQGQHILRTAHFDGRTWSAPAQNSAALPSATQPLVAVLGSGHSFVAWHEALHGEQDRILVQRYAADGSAAGDPAALVTSAKGWSSRLLGLESEGDRAELLFGGQGGAFSCRFAPATGWEACTRVAPEYVIDPVFATGVIDGIAWYNRETGANHIAAATRAADGSWVATGLETLTVSRPSVVLATAGRDIHALWVGYQPKPSEAGYVGWSRFTPEAGWSVVRRVAQLADRFPVFVQSVGTRAGRALAVVTYQVEPVEFDRMPDPSDRAVFAY